MSRSFAMKTTIPLLMLSVAFGAAWTANSGSTLLGKTPSNGQDVGIYSSDTGLANLRAAGAGAAIDKAQWPTASRTVENVTYQFRYPPEWSDSLQYCAPGAPLVESGHLPTGCVSTDILVGQKVRDIEVSGGEALAIDGRKAERLITNRPASGLAEQIYTVVVYDTGGSPVFGFSSLIGTNTDPATLQGFQTNLDAVTRSLRVEVSR